MDSNQQIVVRDGWLNGETRQIEITSEQTLGEIADTTFPENLRAFAQAQLNGEPLVGWESYYARPGDHIVLFIMPQGGGDGGKGALGLIAAIAISVAAPGVGSFIAGALNAATWVGTAVYMVGASIVMSALSKAMFKPPEQQKAVDYGSQNPFLSFTGIGNRMEPWGNVQRVYGRMRVYPKLIVPPQQKPSEGGGSDMWLYMAFDFGYGPLQITNMKLGETPLTNPPFVHEKIVHPNFVKGDKLQYFDSSGYSRPENVQLKSNSVTIVSRQTEPNTWRAVMSFTFPNGYYHIDPSSGKNKADNLNLGFRARPAGSLTWQPANELARISYSRRWDQMIDRGESLAWITLDKWQRNGIWYTGIAQGRTRILAVPYDIDGFLSPLSINANSAPPGTPIPADYTFYFWDWDKLPKGLVLSAANFVAITNGFFLEGHHVNFIWDGREVIFNSYPNAAAVPTTPKADVNMEVAWHRLNKPTSVHYFWDKVPITNPFSMEVQFIFPTAGAWEIEVRNESTVNDANAYSREQVYLSSWQSYALGSSAVFLPDVPHTVVELKIKATNQLSGMIEDFNAMAESLLPIWNGTTWLIPNYNPFTGMWNPPPTRNPAWIYLDILRGAANRRPVPDHLIALDEFKAWADDNDTPAPDDGITPRFLCDMVIAAETTVKAALQTVASTARAAPGRRDALFSIIRERSARTPVQLFTPKNSRDFSSTLTYVKRPHGLKISYVEEDEGYHPTETIVYDDGYGPSNARDFESINLPGVVRYRQAQRAGRYILATAVLQRERVTLSVDIENLIVQRGDMCLIAHDVLKAGGLPRRVTEIIPDAAGPILILDEPVAGANYVRKRGDDTLYAAIVLEPKKIQLPAGTWAPYQGDLIEYGVSETIRAPFLVEEISPASDLSATLTLVEYRPEIEQAVDGPIPPRVVRPGASGEFQIGPVRNLSNQQIDFYDAGDKYARIDLTWDAPAEGIPSYYAVYQIQNGAPQWIGKVQGTYYRSALEVNVSDMRESSSFVFGVQAVIDGVGVGPMVMTTSTVLLDIDPPADVVGFGCNAQTGTLLLFWAENLDPDVHHFEIRYSPDEFAAWADSSLLSGLIAPDHRQHMVPLRPGIYFIKAVDGAGNYSENPAYTVVQISDLEYVDEFAIYDQHPFTDGTHDGTLVDATGDLILQPGAMFGWYTPDPAIHGVHLLAESKMRLYAGVALTFTPRDAYLSSPWYIPLSHAVPLMPSGDRSSNIVDAQIEFRYRTGAAPFLSLIHI